MPPTLRLVVAYDALVGLGGAVLAASLAWAVATDARSPSDAALGALFLAVAAATGSVATVHLAAAWGLARRRPWGRPVQVLAAALGLGGVPFTTLGALVVLVYASGRGLKLFLSDTDPAALPPHDAETLRRFLTRRRDLLPVGLGLLTGPALAILLPHLLRKDEHRLDEAAALGDVRTVLAAEAAYAEANGGHFDRPACLAAPWECIPGHARDDRPFLDAALAARGSHRGYVRAFHAGPPAAPSPDRRGRVSPTGLAAFADVAVPEGAQAPGRRAFCGDASGLVCATAGEAPRVEGGACDRAACRPVG